MLTALAAGVSRPLAILGEVALGPAAVALAAAAALTAAVALAAAVALFATLAACLGCPRRIVREIPAALLPAGMAGARGLLAILGEIAWVACMSLVSHS
jgi:hypothetical protein